MRLPRLMIAASGSGSGKTTVTLGLLQALKERGLRVSSCKCGPDYIDPMFHRTVIGAGSVNLDSFFCDGHTLRYLLEETARGSDVCVIEGVMGFYDGLGGVSDRASTYETAVLTDSPAVLVLDAHGMSFSLAAALQGLVRFRDKNPIRGVILNRISAGSYLVLKKVIEEQIPGLSVYGYLPELPDLSVGSRHLGLVSPREVDGLRGKLEKLAAQMEKTVDVGALIRLADQAPDLPDEKDPCGELLREPEAQDRMVPAFGISAAGEKAGEAAEGVPGDTSQRERGLSACGAVRRGHLRIGIACDEAFSFVYEENRNLLEKFGAELVSFSPMRDRHLPDGLSGLLLYGGYPELHLPELSENRSMLNDVKTALLSGVPAMAECGGFMYLLDQMEDPDHRAFPMAGVLPGRAYDTGKLTRFGYVTLTENGTDTHSAWSGLGPLRAHEFHYYDTTNNGDFFTARKPAGKRSWSCMHAAGNLLAGFPHLYYYSNPETAIRFLRLCGAYGAHVSENLVKQTAGYETRQNRDPASGCGSGREADR